MYPITWSQLITRVMADTIPSQPPDAAYLLGVRQEDVSSVLYRAADLLKTGAVPIVAMRKGGDEYGYVGYENSLKLLRVLGVSPQSVMPVEFLPEFIESKQITMLTELISLARRAKESAWHSIYLVAPPFYQLRAFFSMVTALDHEYPDLKVYNWVGWPLPWVGVRINIFAGEVKRIQSYQKESRPHVLVSVKRMLKYLDQRDAL